jgi:hypothetical protein
VGLQPFSEQFMAIIIFGFPEKIAYLCAGNRFRKLWTRMHDRRPCCLLLLCSALVKGSKRPLYQLREGLQAGREISECGIANPAWNGNFLDYFLLRSEVCIFTPVLETIPL